MFLCDNISEYLIEVLAVYLGGLLGYITSGGLGCSYPIEDRAGSLFARKGMCIAAANGIDRSSVRLTIRDYTQVVVSGNVVIVGESNVCAAAYTQLLAE